MIICVWKESIKSPEIRMAAISLSFGAGILIAAYCDAAVILALGGLALAAAYLFGQKPTRTTVFLLVAIFAVGAARYYQARQVPLDDLSRIPQRIAAFEGTVSSDPDIRPNKQQLTLRVDRVQVGSKWRECGGYVSAAISAGDDEQPKLAYGDRVRVSSSPYHPFDPTNPGQFSWKDYLSRQGIYMCVSVRDVRSIQRVDGASGNPILSAALSAKHFVERSVRRITPPLQASVILGMVLGTYSYLPSETLNSFSRTGTLHLLAASGYNCWLLLAIATPLLGLLHMTPKWRNLLVVLLLITYVLMVGAKASLIRAALMSGIWLLAIPLKRVPNLKNAFFTAGLIDLLMNPTDLFDVGFQLSFVAVWALISAAPVIEAILHDPHEPQKAKMRRFQISFWQRHLIQPLKAAAVATITVSLYTTPIVAFYFNYVSLVSLPANVAVALGAEAIFGIGAASIVVAHVPVLGPILGWMGTRLTDAVLAIVNYLGSVKYACLTVATPSLFVIVLYYLTLHAVMISARSKYAQG